MGYVDIKRISNLLSVKEKTIYKWVEAGSIPFYRIGKLVRFNEEEVNAWMKSKKAVTEEKRVDKITRFIYSQRQGRPSRLGKGV